MSNIDTFVQVSGSYENNYLSSIRNAFILLVVAVAIADLDKTSYTVSILAYVLTLALLCIVLYNYLKTRNQILVTPNRYNLFIMDAVSIVLIGVIALILWLIYSSYRELRKSSIFQS